MRSSKKRQEDVVEKAKATSSIRTDESKIIRPLVKSASLYAVNGIQAILPKIQSTTISIAKGSISYFSPSNINALYNTEKAERLRKVFKSSLKSNGLNFAMAWIFQHIFKFFLLELVLGLPLVRKFVEYTIEPLFQAARKNYFLLSNVVYSMAVHKAVIQSTLVRQETLKSHKTAFLPPLRTLRSLAFYIASQMVGQVLSFIDLRAAFVVEAYFLGLAFIEYKCSYANISIEAGQEISATNNAHYLGLGLSYKSLEWLEQFLMERYFNLPSAYFSNFMVQAYIYLVHAQELPLVDPLKKYNCYFIPELPKNPVGDGVYLVPGKGVSLALKQGEKITEEGMVELQSPLDGPRDEIDGWEIIGNDHFTLYFAKEGKWIVDENQQHRTVQIAGDKIDVRIRREEYIRQCAEPKESKVPIQVVKNFDNFQSVNEAIKRYFYSQRSGIVPEKIEKYYLSYPLQELSDWLLRNSIKKCIQTFRNSEMAVQQKSESQEKKAEQLDLMTLVFQKINRVRSWRITDPAFQFIKKQESVLLLMEFSEQDFKDFLKFVKEYRHLIEIATQTIKHAGKLTKDIQEIAEAVTANVIDQFDQLKKIPILSNGVLNNSWGQFLQKFDDIASSLRVPRWIVMRILLNFLPMAAVIEEFKSKSDSFNKFFDVSPEVALRALISGIDWMHRYQVADSVDKILELIDCSTSSAKNSKPECTPKYSQYAFLEYLTSLEEKITTTVGLKDISQVAIYQHFQTYWATTFAAFLGPAAIASSKENKDESSSSTSLSRRSSIASTGSYGRLNSDVDNGDAVSGNQCSSASPTLLFTALSGVYQCFQRELRGFMPHTELLHSPPPRAHISTTQLKDNSHSSPKPALVPQLARVRAQTASLAASALLVGQPDINARENKDESALAATSLSRRSSISSTGSFDLVDSDVANDVEDEVFGSEPSAAAPTLLFTVASGIYQGIQREFGLRSPTSLGFLKTGPQNA